MIKRLQKAVSIISLCSLLLTASYINVHAEYTKASSKHGMGYIPDPVRETTSTSSSFIKQYTKKATNAPESYDLRDYGLVTPVKDQGTYGMCWTFSTMSSIESNALMKGLGSFDLSELHLGYFAFNGVKNPLPGLEGDEISFQNEGNWYDYGGNSSLASLMLSSGYGPVLESDAPYSLLPGNPSDSLATGHNVFTIKNVYNMAGSNRASMKDAIMTNGAITFGIYMDEDDSRIYNEMNNALYVSYQKEVNHDVSIVGWDDNYSRNNFGHQKPSRDGAWLCKNSWGTDWGNEGYFWVSYEDKPSHFDTCYSYDVMPAEQYKKIYQHDGGLGLWSYDDTISEANVFTATGNDEITAVSNYTESCSGTISIYIGISNGKPQSGTKVTSFRFDAQKPGYHVFTLPDPILVTTGTTYCVVYEFDNKCTVYIDADAEGSTPSSDISVEEGQSYIRFLNGSWWSPDDFNCRIKAFTGSASSLFAANVGSGRVTLSWADVEGVLSYDLYRQQQDGSYTLVKNLPATVNSYTDKNLTIGSTVNYKLIPQTQNLEAVEMPGSIKTILAVPKNLRLSNSSSGVTIKWSSVEKAKKYVLYRKEKGKSYKKLATVKTTNYKDKTAKKGRTYYYKLKAVSSNNIYSAYSTEKKIKR